LIVGDLLAQTTISDIQPRSCKPGETTRLTLSGKDLNASLRVITSHAAANVQVESAEPEIAVVALTLPADAPLGPFRLWTATKRGPAEPIVLMVDDLPSVSDNGSNHTRETAQDISTLTAVDGTSDGSKSDFYRIRVAEGQRVAFEVLTQSIESKMDPVIRLLGADGNLLHSADDDEVGPDSRFSYQFTQAGDFLLEIHDVRYAPGHAYRLRVGDFPILSHGYPLAVRRGESASIEFASVDGSQAEVREVHASAGCRGNSMIVATRTADGQSSAWVPLGVCDTPQFIETVSDESDATEPLSIPIGISGNLSTADERDQYFIRGRKDTLVRVSSRTRSLGCRTLLRMQLFNPAGNRVAETKVSESDEWSFDFKFPDDGEYRLEVTDLLGRGGDGFGYWIEISPSGTFAIALKADAKAREQFAIEQGIGACAIDLQISRFGYDGEIELSPSEDTIGLRILNPRIPAKAKVAKVYLVADEAWQPESLTAINLLARAKDDPTIFSRLDSLALHRVKKPHVPFPAGLRDGVILISGADRADAFCALEPAAAIQFARPAKSHKTTLNLKRIHNKFKAGVSVLPDLLPLGWRVAVKADKDVYNATFTRVGAKSVELASVPLLVFAEFNGRGRVEKLNLPVEWIDPLRVDIDLAGPLVAGKKTTVAAAVHREGDDPQPVTIKFTKLPAGMTAPESVTVPADSQRAEFQLEISPDASSDGNTAIEFEAASKFRGTDFTIVGQTAPLQLVSSPAQIEVYPLEIALDGKKDRRQLVITGYDESKSARDWTHDVQLTSANPKVAEVRGTVVYPIANGESEVVVQHGQLRQSIPVRVTNIDAKRRTAFESEVLVALSKQGCNSGACHGSPSGKNGFRLSLRAFDRPLDELTLIREDFGRRVNRIDPDRSLVLLKPLMKVSHGGGKKLHKQDAAYTILKDWISEGASADPPDTPRCVRLEVYPQRKRVLNRAAGGQQLSVTAHFADGTSRDVTHLAAYESSNTGVATIDTLGRVTAHGRGESAILVRFLEHIEAATMMFVEQVPNFQWTSPATNNFVDELVDGKLRQMQFLPSQTCTDSEFLRRVYLDVIGILPTVQECTAFLDDSSADKRARLIDSLLERDEFAKFWALKWGDLLKMTSKAVGDDGVYKYHRWVEKTLRDNMPYDEFARQLLTASGSTLANPPANFYRTATDTNECVETISQVFLGARLQCAKCHNHPFERWTQDNYYGLGAVFHRVQRRKTQRPGEMFIWTASSGEVTQPRTGEQMKPWLPGAGSIEVSDQQDRREAFAEWLVDPANPYFAKIGANRIWSQLFARGIVDPVDDFRDSNPPSNEPLLDALATDFVESGFDRKHLLRTILNSRTYQAGYQTNALNQDDTIYFSHQTPRLLGAEQLLDAVNHATGLPQAFGNLPAGTKATHLPAPDIVKVDFLKVFGQPERTTVCACERADDSNLGMAIELFNGSTIHERLRDPKNRFRRAIAAGRSAEEALREIYMAAVCRPPSEIELQAALEQCEKREDVAAGLEDVCWALLNTDEFLFQH
jgi:hypothetical protein